MRSRRRLAASLVVVLALGLAACAPAMPESVVPKTKITVGWTGTLTSTNAAVSGTSGNTDVAAVVRARFGDVVDGAFVPDASFGTVKIVSKDPFVVRYDLAQPAWSDSIPLDAADLLLGWAGASGWFGKDAAGAQASEMPVPRVDEFARSMDVTFAHPTIGWQTAVTVPVPAHVVGERAFGLDDAMEAKQAVITAIHDRDESALKKIAKAWNKGFDLPKKGSIPADTLLSSGPFVVDGVESAKAGQSVTLVPNAAYRGTPTPKVARIELVPRGDTPVADAGGRLDIVQVAPDAANRKPIHELERKDFTVEPTDDGTMWAMMLNPRGVFSTPQARIAFMHATSANAMAQRGGGQWGNAFAGTTSMTTAPDSEAYAVVNEDSGFTASLGTPGDEPALQRSGAGVADGARVCVLYDRASEFARGAFASLRETALEAGWNAVDCGADDMKAALQKRQWAAVITRVPIPQTPDQIAAQWGSQGAESITGNGDDHRDELIAQLSQTVDVYQAREIRAQIEASIVRAAVALPIAVNPRITIVERGVGAVKARNGAGASLMWGAATWTVAPS
ncbi:hypothetical protein [Microbacterium sp.]|uniref:hypothetical protein n=1 Tax=Microbacterium sp. TaxID=51671 RepID=UPI003A91617A